MVNEPVYRVTLGRIAAAAGLLYRLRSLLLVLGLVGAVWFGGVTLGSAPSARAMIPLTLILWSALGLGVGHTLARLPEPARPDDGMRRRIRQRVLLAVYMLATAVSVALAGLAVVMTFRTVGLTGGVT